MCWPRNKRRSRPDTNPDGDRRRIADDTRVSDRVSDDCANRNTGTNGNSERLADRGCLTNEQRLADRRGCSAI